MARSYLWPVPIFFVAVIALLLVSPRPSAGFGLHTHSNHGGHHLSHHGSHYGRHYSRCSYGYRPYYRHHSYYGGYRPNYYEHRAPYAFTIRPRRPDYGEFNGRGLIDQSRRSDSTRSAADSYASESGEASRSHASGPDSAATMPYPEHPALDDGDNNPATSGWALLADQPSAALAVFALEATNNPTQGLPKAGYAVAQALLNNNARAIWAIRRALEFEASALHYVPLDESLGERFDELIAGYRHRLEDGTGHPGDDHVMIAALAYMRHDYEIALPAAAEAINIGDRRPTTQTLLKLIEQELID